MGYMRHHALVVTSWKPEKLLQLYNESVVAARLIGKDEGSETLVSCLLIQSCEVVNGYRSMVLLPDGSKEGWGTSDNGDELRAYIIRRIKEMRQDKDPLYCSWVEIQIGGDDPETRVLDSSDPSYKD